MPTGPEHYREAERLVAPGEYDEAGEEALHLRDIQLAQVHATLALAAATAMTGYGGSGMANDDFAAWDKACGVQPGDDIAVGGTA